MSSGGNNIQIQLAQIADQLTQLIHTSSPDVRRQFEVSFRKFLKKLKQALECINDSDKQALMKLLSFVPDARVLRQLSGDGVLIELLTTMIPVLPILQSNNELYSKATQLILDITEELCYRGRSGELTNQLLDLLLGLQEYWCSDCREPASFCIMKSLSDTIATSSPFPMLVISSASDLLSVIPVVYQCLSLLADGCISIELSRGIILSGIFYIRVSGCSKTRWIVLNTINKLIIKLSSLSQPIDQMVIDAVVLLCLQLCAVCTPKVLSNAQCAVGTEISVYNNSLQLSQDMPCASVEKDSETLKIKTNVELICSKIIHSCLRMCSPTVSEDFCSSCTPYVILIMKNISTFSTIVSDSLIKSISTLVTLDTCCVLSMSVCSNFLSSNKLSGSIQKIVVDATVSAIEYQISISRKSFNISKRRKVDCEPQQNPSETLLLSTIKSLINDKDVFSSLQSSKLLVLIQRCIESNQVAVLSSIVQVAKRIKSPSYESISTTFIQLAASELRNINKSHSEFTWECEIQGMLILSQDTTLSKEVRDQAVAAVIGISAITLTVEMSSSFEDDRVRGIYEGLLQLPSDSVSQKLSLFTDGLSRKHASVSSSMLCKLLMSCDLPEPKRSGISDCIVASLRGRYRHVILQELPSLLRALYSPHHSDIASSLTRLTASSLNSNKQTPEKRKSGRKPSKKKSQPTEIKKDQIIGGIFCFSAWRSEVVDATPTTANLMRALGAMTDVAAACNDEFDYTSVSSLLKGGEHNIGVLSSSDPEELSASRELICSLIDARVIAKVLNPTSDEIPNLLALVDHISTVLHAPDSVPPVVYKNITHILCIAARAVLPTDPMSLSRIIKEMMCLLQVSESPSCGIRLTMLVQQELQQMESRLGTSLCELLKRFPDLFEPLLNELPSYNKNRKQTAAPLLYAIADYVDHDVEGFIAELLPSLIAWLIRIDSQPDNTTNPIQRIAQVCNCLKELDSAKLVSVGITAKTWDTKTILGEILLVHAQPILASVLLDTEGSSWTEYFKAVKRQLAFIDEHGRGFYSETIKQCGANLVSDLVISTGKNPDFEIACSKASRALQMYHVCFESARDNFEGKNQSPIPNAPNSKSESVRLKGARDKLGHSFFSILDSIGEWVGVGAAKERTYNPSSVSLGIRVMHGIVLLLGPTASNYTSKLNPTLNMCLQMTNIGPDVGDLLVDTWGSYIDELNSQTISNSLDTFVIEVVGLARVSRRRSAELLIKLFDKTSSKNMAEWEKVHHLIPTTGEYDDILNAMATDSGITLEGSLPGILNGLRSVSKECRSATLLALCNKLRSHRSEVTPTREEYLKLIHCLLKMSRDWDGDSTIHNNIMYSLGMLGAIQPNIMQGVNTRSDGKLEDLDDELFAVNLINNFLVKTLRLQSSQAGKTHTHDKAAYAIQELLKSLIQKSREAINYDPKNYQKQSTKSEVANYSWWNKISSETRDQIAVYLDTKYVVVVTQHRNAKQVEFQPGMNFRTWLKAWIVNLIGKAKSFRGQVLQNVRNVVKDDIELALYVLPYLVLNVCLHGGEDAVNNISQEFDVVLTWADEHPGEVSEHVQIICSLIDKQSSWCNEIRGRLSLKKSNDRIKVSADDEAKTRHVSSLMEKVPHVMLARACRVTNPARALLYTEQHLRNVRTTSLSTKRHTTQLSQAGVRSWCDPKDLCLYQEVYSKLQEPDGLLGVKHLRQQNAIQEQLHEQAVDLETIGMWSDATQRYELLLEQFPGEAIYQERMMECLKSLGQYSVMIAYAENRIELRKYTTQAAWRLGDWDLVEKSLEEDAPTGKCKTMEFERGIANSLLSIRRGDYERVQKTLELTRSGLHSDLAAACLESYETAYKHLVKLHVLTDIERSADFAASHKDASDPAEYASLINELTRHASFTEETPETRDIILSVRRAVASIFGLQREANKTWLEIGKLCRKGGLFQVAEGALLRAERVCRTSHRPPGLLMEQARLLIAQGKVHAAIRIVSTPLERDIRQYEPDHVATSARMRLRAVNWACDVNHLPQSEVLAEYQSIAKQKPSEQVFVSLAKFLEKMLIGIREGNQSSALDTDQKANIAKLEALVIGIRDTVPSIINSYCYALQYGTKHLYHSLPRVISVYTNEVTALSQITTEASTFTKIIALCTRTRSGIDKQISDSLGAVSGGVLYTSLNNFVSLLTHQSHSAVHLFAKIIRRIVKLFPRRAVWPLMGLRFSLRKDRLDVYKREILSQMRGDSSFKTSLELVSEAEAATTAINLIAAYKVSSSTKTINIHSLDFYKPLGKKFPLRLVVPIQEQLTLTLPECPVPEGQAASLFSSNEAFAGVEHEVSVMASLQNPKKVTFITSTGASRSFLCKARDELRKDNRIMELCHIMNLLLKKNQPARQRKLYTRTFCVTMTGDASGMIEWVNNVKPFRMVLDDLYLRAGKGLTHSQIRSILKLKEAKKLTAAGALDKILIEFPPILHKWLSDSFTDPTTWFRTRNTYTKSASVWSMIGHIVGLGDRHAENILVDMKTGDLVHVDFAILFDRGMTLQVPEVVRCRLTQNVVAGFGICGVEGVFRRCSEITMSVMREHKDMVLSIMDLFLQDPSMEKGDGVELYNINRRLDGYFDEPSEVIRRKQQGRITGGVQLGIEGQVQKIIANATSHENLSVIYTWWMPWY